MKSVLIVDDVAIFRELLEHALTHAGFRVTSAASGPVALASLRSRAPDAVLLDVEMPGLDGVAVLKRMRENPALRNIPVLMLSATTDRTRIVQAARHGIRGYVVKSSVSMRDLVERVRSLTSAQARAPAPPAAA